MSPNESESIFGRQWQLIQCLSESADGLSVDEIVAKTSCSKRTVRRHLALFREYGIPLVETTAKHGLKKYKIALGSAVPSFSFDEVAAVYIGRRFLEPMMGTFFWQAMQSALEKMRTCLGTQAVRHLERSVGVIKHTPFGRADYSERAALIDDLNFSVAEKRRIAILYQTLYDSEPSITHVDPYGLAFHTGSLYLVGFSYKRQEIRHWKIDRLKSVTITNETFQEPAGFQMEKHLARFSASFAATYRSH